MPTSLSTNTSGSRTSSRRSAPCPWPGGDRDRDRGQVAGNAGQGPSSILGMAWPRSPRPQGLVAGMRGGRRQAPRSPEALSRPRPGAGRPRSRPRRQLTAGDRGQADEAGHSSSRCRWCARPPEPLHPLIRTGGADPGDAAPRRPGPQRSWTWGSQAALRWWSRPRRTAAMMRSRGRHEASSRTSAPPEPPHLQLEARSKRRGHEGGKARGGCRAAAGRSRAARGRQQAVAVLATSGAASSTEAGCGASAGSSDARRRPRGQCGPRWGRSAPLWRRLRRPAKHRLHVQMCGTLRSTTGFVGRSDAATWARGVLVPGRADVPLSGCPPLRKKLSMTLPARGRSGTPPIYPADLGGQALARACRAGRTLEVPVSFSFQPRSSPDAALSS